MRQWIAEIATDTTSGVKTSVESFYLPREEDVRREIIKRGAYCLSIRAYERSPMERLLARSSWWQVQLLRGIQFRSTSTSPGVAFWRLIEGETNPTRQNILSPAKEALSRGLGIIDALKALNIFDRGTLAILSASEKANKLVEGIPHAISTITQKRKNMRAIGGTMAWLGFDVLSIVQAMFWGKDLVLGWFHDNAPTEVDKLAEYNDVVGKLELTWNILILIAVAATVFMVWCILSFFLNRGKDDWPTARIVRKIPLIGAYMRDLGFADSMSTAARMLRGKVPINEMMIQSAESASVPDIALYWHAAEQDLKRGIPLGSAMDREPLNRSERLEIASLSDLSQIATIMESISEMRAQNAKGKHSLILWLAFGLTGLYLAIAFGSAIFALTVMNMSMDSLLGGLTSF
ncbi:MAG: type II secretion system protein [Micavibrio sp.]|nr:type II secretion system protein [Micavibrio sp.]|tara:strand:- start:606 stop:1820 length:1215 start_codon:yes stop_codon:yes gene_type:complete